MKRRLRTLLLFATLSLTSCGGNSSIEPTINPTSNGSTENTDVTSESSESTTTTSESSEDPTTSTHVHAFSEWTETEDKLNHTRNCECGETETEPHQWNSGRVTTPATHTSDGVMTYECEVCHATKTEKIDKITEHQFGEWVKIDDNEHQRTCTCGEVEKESHHWDDGAVLSKGSYNKEGTIIFTCPDCGATKTQSTEKVCNPNLIMALDFDDSSNRAKNAALNTDVGDATIVSDGHIGYEEDTIKGNTSVHFVSNGVRKNYLRLPNSIMNNEVLTVSGWFKIDANQPVTWGRLFYMGENVEECCDSHRLEMMPFQGEYGGIKWDLWDGGDNHWYDGWLSKGNFNLQDPNIPAQHSCLQPKDMWINYTWVLKDAGFKLYTNGRLAYEDNLANLSPTHYVGENGKGGIAFCSTFRDDSDDFSCSIADLRVYNTELSSAEIVDEFDINYEDSRALSLDFENGLIDSVRGFKGTLGANTTIQEENGNHYLNFAPGGVTGESGLTFTRADNIFKGLHQFTLDLDVYVDATSAYYSRIFQAAINSGYGGAVIALWVGDGKGCLKFSTNWDENASYMEFNLPTNEWHNLVVSLDSFKALVALDGVTVANADFAYYDSILYTDTSILTFGDQNAWTDAPFIGKMDNIQFYGASVQKELDSYGRAFLDFGVVDGDDVVLSRWASAKYLYETMSPSARALVAGMSADKNGTDIQKALAIYDDNILWLDSSLDFMERLGR